MWWLYFVEFESRYQKYFYFYFCSFFLLILVHFVILITWNFFLLCFLFSIICSHRFLNRSKANNDSQSREPLDLLLKGAILPWAGRCGRKAQKRPGHASDSESQKETLALFCEALCQHWHHIHGKREARSKGYRSPILQEIGWLEGLVFMVPGSVFMVPGWFLFLFAC